METKFTKGPWITEYQQYEDCAHICAADSAGNWIADCGPEGNKEAEANAQLIASAPELLEALQNIVEYEKRCRTKGEPHLSEKWFNEAQQAISKATGKYKPKPHNDTTTIRINISKLSRRPIRSNSVLSGR